MSYKIGSFNLHNLNFAYGKDVKRNFAEIAQIIKRENFDVVAMQEVLSDNVWKDQLCHYFDRDVWKFCWEQPRKTWGESVSQQNGDMRGEGYAYLWNSGRLDLVRTKTDMGWRTAWPQIWKQYPKYEGKMMREPYYARFTPCEALDGCYFELRLINVHLVYGHSVFDRQKEFYKLTHHVYPHIADKQYKSQECLPNGDCMPAYTVILGDYNLKMNQGIESVTIDTQDRNGHEISRTLITFQHLPTTLNQVTGPNGETTSDGYSENDYDHFTADKDLRSRKGIRMDVHRVDAVRKEYRDDFAAYRKEISDHVPVSMDFRLKS